MISAIYEYRYGHSPLTNDLFCQANAFISITAGSAEFLYNCAFCVWLIIKVKTILKPIPIKKWIFHCVCCLGNNIIFIYLYIY